MSMFASDFDGNKAGSIEHSKDSAISRRKTENYYNRSKSEHLLSDLPVLFLVCIKLIQE